MDRVLISVIIPVYNCQNYVGRCIESVINQSYRNIEIIIINDGSTDNSLAVCKSFSDSRTKVIDSRHYGASKARNIGIENSNGSFIFFIDADDFIEKDALGLLIENQHGSDLVIGDFRKVRNGDVNSGNSRVFTASKLLNKQDIIDYARRFLRSPNRFPLLDNCWGRLFKASIIKNNKLFYDVSLRTSEDVSFNFNYLKYVEKIFFLNKPIYNHSVWDDYSSASMFFEAEPEDLFGYRKAFDRVADFFNSCNLKHDIKKEIANAYVGYTIIQLVRCCGQINKKTRKKIYEFINNLVNEIRLQDSLQFYAPSNGDSKILPVLIKLKFITPIILVCKYKAYKRYKKQHQNEHN
jgi:glycosyltransferase EpsJ